MYPIHTLWLGLLLCAHTALPAQKTLTVNLRFQNCTAAPKIFTFDGAGFAEFQTGVGENGTYVFTLPAAAPRFYYVGADMGNHTPVILGSEPNVQLVGDCANLRAVTVVNSPLNDQYIALRNEFGRLNNLAQQANLAYRGAMNNPAALPGAKAELAEVDNIRQRLLDSLRTANPFLAQIAALNTYLSFPNHGEGRYPNELMYFVAEYFRFVDWTQPALNQLPWVFESYKAYTTTLLGVNLPNAQLKTFLEQSMAPIAAGSGAHKLALSGVLAALRAKNNPNFVPFAEVFIKQFGASDPASVASLQQEVRDLNGFVEGGEAPDFAQATPDGDMLSLHSLRGKVVLIDFWASWCGPCRAENPNVVRMYNEYRERGFEILGVSLDRARDRWLQAIEQDGLTWLHVSDLKGWQNEVAQRFSVSSIPHTILLDAEGRIIARGLRGAALEAKLAEIFN